MAGATSTSRRAVRSRRRFGVYGRGFGETFGVDEEIAGRGQQWGGRFEAGVRFSGPGGALELFGGFERMIDADPLDRTTRHVGVRRVSPDGNVRRGEWERP